jgi:hypothetical protein
MGSRQRIAATFVWRLKKWIIFIKEQTGSCRDLTIISVPSMYTVYPRPITSVGVTLFQSYHPTLTSPLNLSSHRIDRVSSSPCIVLLGIPSGKTIAPWRRRRATTMGQQRGNGHQQAKTMSYQQREFLQLVQGLAPHRPLPIFRTYQSLVIVVIAIAADVPGTDGGG